nr:hypothetical protein BaRGS_023133 [Batillaria attramentaria]
MEGAMVWRVEDKRFQSLKYLDLSGNQLQELSTDVFLGLDNLYSLDLAWNTLTLSDETYPPGVFRPFNASLVRLRLEGNCQAGKDNCRTGETSVNLTYPDKALSDLANLETLYIDGLPEVSFGPGFANMTKLHSLHLLGSKNYYCLTSDGKDTEPMDNFFGMIKELEKSCADLAGILVGAVSCFICLMIALTSALAYRFRWKLRYLYYASRLNYRPQHNEEDSFEFDAFVSYASEDNDFVHGELVERLEERAGLRLNVHNRDWIPGRPIPTNIVAAVQSSRRTLVVLTRHLLESDWCQYEMQMATMEAAYTGRDVLLFLLYEDVPSHELPRQVLYNLQASTYILYPHQHLRDQRLVNDFWQRLAQAIRD